ncbi:hypothetical protein A3Q56_05593 [Intoshia linei]|uniref:C2H2-type domain-containing protein n=1 Tax=Intoshia linei TaxID=1819745 RepID=A0A177AX75_9BILA|nr:hypothetical protein A3Q56_05593 [Intoshia linei]
MANLTQNASNIGEAIVDLCKANIPYMKDLNLLGAFAIKIDDNSEMCLKLEKSLSSNSKFVSNLLIRNKRKRSKPLKFNICNGTYSVNSVQKKPIFQLSVDDFNNGTTVSELPKRKYIHVQSQEYIPVNNKVDMEETAELTRENSINMSYQSEQGFIKPKKRKTADSRFNLEEIGEYLGEGENISGSIKCTQCKLVMNGVNVYFKHCMDLHYSYICHDCGKFFTIKSSLLRHRPIHTGLRRFACRFCQRSFYRRDKCKTHIKKHLTIEDVENNNVEDFSSIGTPSVFKNVDSKGAIFYNISFKHKCMVCPCSINIHTNGQKPTNKSTPIIRNPHEFLRIKFINDQIEPEKQNGSYIELQETQTNGTYDTDSQSKNDEPEKFEYNQITESFNTSLTQLDVSSITHNDAINNISVD